MYLYIDTTERESFTIALVSDSGIIKQYTEKSAQKNSERLLPAIEELLKEAEKEKSAIKGIAAVEGPGSFTSLRIGVVTANALAYGLGVPIIAVEKGKGIDKIGKMFNTVQSFESFNKPMLPKYGSEPKIS